MKLEKGANKFRILASPIMGYVGWKDKKPSRYPMDEEFDPHQFENFPKHFWAFPVWNYATESVQCLEVTQKGIQKAIKALTDDKDWGDPKKFDINITRTGEMLETEYSVMPSPKKVMSKEANASIKEVLETIQMDNLFNNESPFPKEAETQPGIEKDFPIKEDTVEEDGTAEPSVEDLPF
jgi:hypothetical protein